MKITTNAIANKTNPNMKANPRINGKNNAMSNLYLSFIIGMLFILSWEVFTKIKIEISNNIYKTTFCHNKRSTMVYSRNCSF